MAHGGAEGLTQSLGEKMAAVMDRYGKPPERPNARPCVLCGTEVADPLMAGHLAMHEQAQQCDRCRSAAKLDEHLAHVHAAIAESEADQAAELAEVRRRGATQHRHGELTAEQQVVGDALRIVINDELDPGESELLARRWHEVEQALAPLFGYRYNAEPVSWEELPARQRALAVATVNALISDGSIKHGGRRYE